MRRGLWLWAIIVGALVVALPAISQRAALEKAARTVELVADLERMEALSQQTGVPIPELLARWRELGVTSVAVADPVGARLAMAAGLRVVPRDMGTLVLASTYGWETGPVVFSGDSVGGYPDRLSTTAALLQGLGAPLGLIEFAAQHGALELARLLDYAAVRVHSISLEELARMNDADAAARFARAARERHARVLYVRPLVRGPVSEMLARNDAYLTAITDRLEDAGLTPGPVQPFPLWKTSIWVPVTAAAAATAGAMLLVGRVVPLPGWLAFVAIAGSGAVVFGLRGVGNEAFARQLAALEVAVVFPALAVLTAAHGVSGFDRGLRLPHGHSASDRGERSSPDGHRRRGVAWGLAVGQFVAVTACGALLVAASLGDTRFILQVEQFRGVKLSHVAPLALVALFWIVDQYRGSWIRWLQEPVRVWHVLVAAVVLVFGYIYVGRTGNDVVAVLDLERALRVGLEDALLVRPRTKEFLLGYPAALIGLGFWVRARRALAWPFLTVGTVASISMINTFAHAHSPLAVSALRSAYGIAGGALVAAGSVVVAVIVRRLPTVRGWRMTSGGGPAGTVGGVRETGYGSGGGHGAGPGSMPGAGVK